MKNLKFTLSDILVLVLLVIIVVQYCSTPEPINPNQEFISVDGRKYEVIERKGDTTDIIKVDSGIKINLPEPQIIYKDRIVYLDTPVDTTEILKDYFATRVYTDVIYLSDSLGKVIIIDTVSENKIINRIWQSEITKRYITNTTIVKDPPRTEVYYGFKAGFDKSQLLSSVSTGLLLKNKKDNILSTSIGVKNNSVFNNSVEPYIEFGYYKKIKLGKR